MSAIHEEILCNESMNNAVYISSRDEKDQLTLYSLIVELKKIYREVGNGAVTISCIPDQMNPDSKERRLILTVSTSDDKIHSYHIHK